MNWVQIKKDEEDKIKLINPDINKYRIFFSPHDYTPIESVENDGVNDEEPSKVDTEVIYYTHIGVPSEYELKQILINLINEYDECDELNSFIFRNELVRFDSGTRLSLINSINTEKKEGKTTYLMWFNNHSCNIEIDYLLEFLTELDKNAKLILNTTKVHINNVNDLTSIESILNYDITKDYPENIIFDETKII